MASCATQAVMWGDDLKMSPNQSCPPLPYGMKVKDISFRSKKKKVGFLSIHLMLFCITD